MKTEYIKNRVTAVLSIFVAAFLSGCAIQTNYASYEGDTVVVGEGGTKTVVDGIEIWEDGTPPRKFKVQGVITDKRPTSRFAQGTFHSSIAAKVKETGGDAAIITGQNEVFKGMVGSGYTTGSATRPNGSASATTFSAGTPVNQVTSKIWVVKYLPE